MNRVAVLYQDHLPYVWRLVRRLRVLEADVDDVAHDVFAVVVRILPTGAPHRGSPSTPDQERALLYKVTEYQVKKYHTRGSYRRTEPMDESINEIADPRNDAARSDHLKLLFELLDSTEPPGRAVFELVELEGFSVAEAARVLEIPESTARKRLAIAQRDIEAAAKRLAKSDQETGQKRASAFLLPFGVGAWLQLRDLQNPPPGAAEKIWKRLQATVAEMARQVDLRTSIPPRRPPRSRLRALSRLAHPLRNPWTHLVSVGVGAAVMALVALRPSAPIAILRLPAPVVLLTATATPTTRTNDAPGPPAAPALEAASAPAPSGANSAADTELDTELVFVRRARMAYVAGNREAAANAIKDYDKHYPAGRFKPGVDELRALLADGGVP